jgi:hypothetical protein
MARRKATLVAGTALVAVPDRPVVLNADRERDPANPHSWLELLGDPADAVGLRVMWGVLRARHLNVENSASAFVAAKLRPSWSPDPSAATAAWVETLTSADADDSFADAALLAARIDREIARDIAGSAPLLGYATITDPGACRIHVFREELRAIARGLVEAHGGAVIAVVHAPGRAGNGNPLHGHLCVTPYIVDGPLGFSRRIAAFCGDAGRQVILDAWHARHRFV